jgi:hypothetical protein
VFGTAFALRMRIIIKKYQLEEDLNMATSQPKEVLLRKFETYILNKLGNQDKLVIPHRLAHIEGHKAGLKIWLEGRQRDAEIRDYFNDKEQDNRDGYFFYNTIMKPSRVDSLEKILCVKSGNKQNLFLTFTKK